MNLDKPLLAINLDIIKQNYLSICSLLDGGKVAAVVKADCYGIGAKQVVPRLFSAGCRDFMTSNIEEAIIVRESLRDVNDNSRIYVLGGIFQSTRKFFHEYNIIPVINHPEQLKIWQDVKNPNNRLNEAVIHIDTGMNRLGMKGNDIEMIFANKIDISGLNIIMLMSHLVASDEPKNNINIQQLNQFLDVCNKISENNYQIKKSISNSGGVFLGSSYHLDMVRVGAALYGLYTHPDAYKYIQSPLKLTAPIIQLQDIAKGEKIGYNGTYTACRNMRIATIPVGYADGLHRILDAKGKVFINNLESKIVGRVSMDLITIDVTDIPVDSIKHGSKVEILGPNQTPGQLAHDANSIGYEMLTSLGNRYRRVYT